MAHILRVQRRADGKMQIQDWGTMRETIAKLVIRMRSAGKIVVFTAHEKYDKDEATGVLKFAVNWPGGFADTIAAYFSDFWRCEARPKGDKVEYYVRTQPNARISLKNSLGLPAEFELTADNIKKYMGQVNV